MDKIGRYEIENEIARGGMGVVYLGRDPLMKRKVAVKLLKESYSRDPEVRGRFEREAEAVASLEHPAIVPIYDFGEHQGQLYYVMRFLPGGTLRDLISDERLTLKELSPVLIRVAEALDAAHEAGIVHRDIKPANILFDDDAQAYLSDFGVAKVSRAVDTTGTQVVGTPQYMSPEQAQGMDVDGRCDVYALGIVAWHALAGRPPFKGANAIAVALAHVTEPVPSLRAQLNDLPKVVDRVFARAMAKKPEHRYPTAGEFMKDLGDIAAGRWYLVKLADDQRPQPGPPPVRDRPDATEETDPADSMPASTVEVTRVPTTGLENTEIMDDGSGLDVTNPEGQTVTLHDDVANGDNK